MYEKHIINLGFSRRSLPLVYFICLLLYSKVCRTPGPTACSRTKMVQLDKVCLKVSRKEKNSMTGPRQPRTCSHLINKNTADLIINRTKPLMRLNHMVIK